MTDNSNGHYVESQRRLPFRPEFVFLTGYLFIIFFSPQERFAWLAPLRPALTVAILTAVASFMNRSGAKSAMRPRINIQGGLLITLSILFLISLFLNDVPLEVFSAQLFGFLKLAALYFLIAAVVKTRDDLEALIKVVLLFTSLIAVYGLLAYKFKWGDIQYRMVSPFGGLGSNSNGFAMLLLGVLPFGVAFIFRAESVSKKFFFTLLTISILMCIVKTRSRMGFLGALIQMPLLLWHAKLNRKSVLLLALCLAVPIMHAHENLWKRVSTIQEIDEEIDIWSADRRNKWRQATILIKKYPIFGVGQTEFRDAVRRHGLGEYEHVVHNAYLEVGAEAGIPAMLAFLGLVISALRKTWQSAKMCRLSGESALGSISWVLFVAILSYAFCLIFLSEQYNSMLFLLLGLSTSCSRLSQARFVAQRLPD